MKNKRRTRLIFLIISGVLLLAVISGLIMAYRLPTVVKQETVLLNYQQEGRFDYLIHLIPSYLFGSPPPPEPSNPLYPARIVSTIDFTFTYKPVSQEPQMAKVDLGLENPGIWQKTINLVPATNIGGDSTLTFSLNIDDLQKIFEDIEAQIEIGGDRNLTINCSVTAPGETFVQSLPINLSDTLIEVSYDLKHTQDCGSGVLYYTVNLQENLIYDVSSLKPPPVPEEVIVTATLKPGDVILTNLVTNMDTTFYYRFQSDWPARNITTEASIMATVEAPDLWSKQFPLKYTESEDNFDVSFPVDLAGYLQLIDNVRAETGVTPAGNIYNITLTADVHITAETDFGPIDKVFTQTMKGTLQAGVLIWDKELTKTEPGSITQTVVVSNPDRFLGLRVNEARIIFAVATGIFAGPFLYLLVMYIRLRPVEDSPIIKEARRARKKYKGVISDVVELPAVKAGETVITFNSLDELATAADAMLKPVLHLAETDKHTYCVIDGLIRYEYVNKLESSDYVTDLRAKVQKLIDKEMGNIKDKGTE